MAGPLLEEDSSAYSSRPQLGHSSEASLKSARLVSSVEVRVTHTLSRIRVKLTERTQRRSSARCSFSRPPEGSYTLSQTGDSDSVKITISGCLCQLHQIKKFAVCKELLPGGTKIGVSKLLVTIRHALNACA